MEFTKTKISGLFLIQNDVFKDDRGFFVKSYQLDLFEKLGIKMDLEEQYFSISKKSVIRGMHFQILPHAQNKLVSCTQGSVFDVVCDLRQNSPTYGKSESFELSFENAKALYIPKGLVHGFQATSEASTMYYQVSKMYSKQHEQGICYDSLGIDWPLKPAIINERDRILPALKEYKSPFYF